jgi:predicted nucleic acid-binding protein
MMALVLDTGALIALERGDREMAGRLSVVRRHGLRVIVPAGCVAQALRDPRRQVPLVRLLRLPATEVVGLDETDAWVVGMLLARSGGADVVDAHVALVAQRLGAPVVTSDPDDLRAIDPSLDIVAI